MSTKIKTYLFLVLFSIITLPGATTADTSQFDFLSFIKSAYDAYNKVKNFLNPDPSLADLITQAKEEIINEINEVRVEEQIGNVNALIDEYTIYLNNPPSQQTIEAWIRDAINVVNQFELIIQDKNPHLAYLSAKAYNMLIPLLALMMQREGIQTEDIQPLFEDMIATNQTLIGEYCWDEMPNAPIYWDQIHSDGTYDGKLLKCYHDGEIDWTEYLNIYDIVWTANEEVRKYIMDRYADVWFYISNERGPEPQPISPEDNKYLCAHSRPNRTVAEVTVADLRPGDSDFLWRLEFQTGHLAKIVHWSGKYLALGSDKKTVIITSKPVWENEVWYFNSNYFSNHDRVTITANIDDGYWLTASGDTTTPTPTSHGPSVLGYENWIIHYALRKAGGIGFSAFPCPADYDGDGKADLGMKTNDGRWLIDLAENGFGSWDQAINTLTSPAIEQYAQPAAADYDGDGKADIAVKNDMTAQWCIDYATNGFGSWDFKRKTGSVSDAYRFHPLPADYDGDGKADIAMCTNYGQWSIDYTSDGFTGWDTYPHSWDFYYPDANLYPAPADYDGDGKTDVSIKLDDGSWLIDFANNDFDWTNNWDWTSFSGVNYGDISAQPLPGYYYASDRYADLGVRTDEGRWMVDYAFGGWSQFGIDWISDPIYGGKNDLPIPADYDGDGVIDLSVIGEEGTWSIDFSADGYQGWDWTSTLSLVTGVSVSESGNDHQSSMIRDFKLSNYPNPFNSSTTIHYSVSKPDHITIRIYNIMGAEIATLVNETKEGGEYSITWHGRDKFGRIMPSGIYVCEMLTQNTFETNKMLLIK